jgi:hypothetical protein
MMAHSPNTGLYPITSSSSWGPANPIIKQEIQIREVTIGFFNYPLLFISFCII